MLDLLLVQDDTGSVLEIQAKLQAQIKILAEQLDKQGWDYRFLVLPLTGKAQIEKIGATRFDPAYGSDYIRPFPGDPPSDRVPSVGKQRFVLGAQYLNPVQVGREANLQNSLEPGLSTLKKNLDEALPGVSFVRSGSLMAVMVISNGEDTSGVSFCPRSDGIPIPCPGSDAASMAQFEEDFKKKSSTQLHFVAAVSSRGGPCLGSVARKGARYQTLAERTGGLVVDLCTEDIGGVVLRLAQFLKQKRLEMRTNILLLEKEPEPGTLRLFRHPDGNLAVATEMTRGRDFKELGWVQDVYQIDAPYLMRKGSGYGVELIGESRLKGLDTVSYRMKPKGLGEEVTYSDLSYLTR
jgi:hypothetical protein